MKAQEICDKIKRHATQYTPKQAKIADYILNHRQAPAFSTATELAQKIGVSQPSLIRFAQLLGFKKYRDFKTSFEASIRDELSSLDRLNLSLKDSNETLYQSQNIITLEIESLTSFARAFPWISFNEAVEKICSSNRVFIAGCRGSEFLVNYFAYFMAKIKKSVNRINCGATTEYEKILPAQADDLLIAFAFPRYPRETIDFVDFFRNRGIYVIGITEEKDSPLGTLSKIRLIVPVTFNALFDSYCCALCLCNMLITAVGRKNRSESVELFSQFENLVSDLRIFI